MQRRTNSTFLVVIDSHSKWLEVFPIPSTTSHNTIEALRGLFASYGLPEELVSDNGPQLVSHEFTQFLERNGIKHTTVPAYHPASNGAAERSVQILERALMKNVLEADGELSTHVPQHTAHGDWSNSSGVVPETPDPKSVQSTKA